ncbi:aldehyde dehydrogenase family protein [Roseivivax sp. CAU 1761]
MTASFDPARVDLPVGHRIGGRLRPAAPELEIRRPSDGVAIAGCPLAGADLVDEAVETARTAWERSGWGRVAPRERLRVLHAWADRIEAQADELARVEAVPSTRPVAQARAGDVAVTAEQIRFFAEFADKEGGTLAPTGDDRLGLIADEPYGVVGAIAPWNVPLSMAGWKLGPALAAGNAVVLKPSEMTPFSTLRLVELAEEAGLPPGLVNVVLGDGPGTGAALVGHPGVAKVSFTGSSAAGSAIMQNVARAGIKPMTLELGGKSPQVVFADADLDRAAECVARGFTNNAGQVCVAGSRLLVEAAIAERFTEAVLARLEPLRPGPTWDAASAYSPIISERQIARIERIVNAARAAGAEVMTGGARFNAPGYFYRPTVLRNVAPDCPALREEIFGPVLTVETFETEEEAAARADHPDYGLCAGVYTRDLGRAVRMSRAIGAGTVWVNRYGRSTDHIMPTGGFKGSGIGKDLGREAYRANRRQKSVLIDL